MFVMLSSCTNQLLLSFHYQTVCQHCASLLFQLKLKISVQNVTTTCVDLDFIFRIIRNGSCNTIQSCTNEVATGKKNCHKIRNHNGRSRISQKGGASPRIWGIYLLFGKNVAENCMKMKEIGPRGWGAHVPGAPMNQCEYIFVIFNI